MGRSVCLCVFLQCSPENIETSNCHGALFLISVFMIWTRREMHRIIYVSPLTFVLCDAIPFSLFHAPCLADRQNVRCFWRLAAYSYIVSMSYRARKWKLALHIEIMDWNGLMLLPRRHRFVASPQQPFIVFFLLLVLILVLAALPGHYLCSRTSQWLVSVSQLNGFETNRSTSTTIQTISDCVCVCVRSMLFARP